MCSVTVCLSSAPGWEITYNFGNVCVVLLFSAQRTVFVFKDIVLFSQNSLRLFCFKQPLWQETREDVES